MIPLWNITFLSASPSELLCISNPTSSYLGSEMPQRRLAATCIVLMPRKPGALCQHSPGRSHYADVLPSVRNQRQLWSKHLLCYFACRRRSPYLHQLSFTSPPTQTNAFPGIKTSDVCRQDASLPTIKFHLEPVVILSLLHWRRLQVSFSFLEREHRGTASNQVSLKFYYLCHFWTPSGFL